MKKSYRSITMILAVVLSLMVLLTGCANGNGGAAQAPTGGTDSNKNSPKTETPATPGNSSSEFVLGEEPLEFTFYGNYDWYTMPNWGEDPSTTWIKETKKVNIAPVSSGGNASQKMSTMFASGELPDVIWGERGADVERLRAAGLLVPLDEYIEKYPNLKEWAGSSTLELLRSSDGKIYQFPNWYTLQPNGNAGYAVNKKIYNELGAPKLETLDDFYAYLKLVKENYPDVVPFEVGDGAEGLSVFMSAFAENYNFAGMQAVPKDGQLTSIFTDPTFREATMFSSKLFREKLVTQDAFSQQREQVEQKVITGKVAVFAAYSPTEFCGVGNEQLKALDPDDGYIMVWPIHKEGLDKNKVYPGTYNQLGWNVSVITTAAKNPEAIFAYLDWLTGPEGQRVIMWGPEGMFWNGVDENRQPIFTDDYVNKGKELAELTYTTESMNWVGNTVYVDRSKAAFEADLPEEQRNWQTNWQYEITWKTQMNVTEFINLTPPGESDEGIINQSVEDIYSQAWSKAIQTATSDEEVLAILDQAEKDAQQAGYARLLEYKTARWQENLAKIQK